MRIYNKVSHRNKTLVIRLLKEKQNRSYHLVLTRKRSKGTSRLDSFGIVGRQRQFAYLKLNLLRFARALQQQEVYISTEVLKLLNIDFAYYNK